MFSRATAILRTSSIITLKRFWITNVEYKKSLFYHFLPWIIIIATANKLRNSLNDIFNCCKLQIVFKSQNKLAKAFCFKDSIPRELTSGVVYKLCRECVGHLIVRTGEWNVSIE